MRKIKVALMAASVLVIAAASQARAEEAPVGQHPLVAESSAAAPVQPEPAVQPVTVAPVGAEVNPPVETTTAPPADTATGGEAKPATTEPATDTATGESHEHAAPEGKPDDAHIMPIKPVLPVTE